LDTLCTLYYSLAYNKGLESVAPYPLACQADRFVLQTMATRDRNRPGKFPHFAISCMGHQPTKESLLRAKKERIAELKKKSKTRKNRGS
jgi:hypothetical protein